MPQPNVLLICVDHWPGRLIGATGHPVILTPTLNTLMENGVCFPNAYTTTPSCIPARRELFTGMFSPKHGDRVFNETLPMPDVPSMAQVFRNAGYQAYAVGKLHVYPQRSRNGFDDVILNEEGRHHLGHGADDYEMFLAEQGYAGQEFGHAMGSNDYCTRPWHLPEYCHPTTWTVREMSKVIRRRDPTRPAFWYTSFQFPHPPLVPLPHYMDLYNRIEIDMPFMGEWAENFDAMPYALKARRENRYSYSANEIRLARQAFYAQCTHVDHQIRLLIGLLREQKLLDNTIVMFISDHGDMLGNHGIYAKDTFYEDSARIPMILVPTADYQQAGHHQTDKRLAVLADVMPTLLDMCDIPIPAYVEGLSLVREQRRDHIFGEHWDDIRSSRMIYDGRHKLIYYPVGNRSQLFDLHQDPSELHDLSADPAYVAVRQRLEALLVQHFYESDVKWLDGDRLIGEADIPLLAQPDRGLGGQRGYRYL